MAVGTDVMGEFERLIRLLSTQAEPGSAFPDIIQAAMDVSMAEAGSIYIENGGEFWFAWAQNAVNEGWNGLYPAMEAKVSRQSLAGYSGYERKELWIEDVYGDLSRYGCSFDRSFDDRTGFRTRNSLTIPLVVDNVAAGVMQVLNLARKDDALLRLIAGFATNEVARTRRIRNDTIRLLRTAALRDPLETAEHVRRVADLAVVLRTEYGLRHGEPFRKIVRARNSLYYSAMLHDIGKVGIPDKILKKPGRLTQEEREAMEQHSRLGWKLFDDGASTELDRESRDVILHHHQRWDGRGYPREEQLAGESIPFSARIVSLADIWDALVSKRCYKEPMPKEDAEKVIRDEGGKALDPEIVDIFLDLRRRGAA